MGRGAARGKLDAPEDEDGDHETLEGQGLGGVHDDVEVVDPHLFLLELEGGNVDPPEAFGVLERFELEVVRGLAQKVPWPNIA